MGVFVDLFVYLSTFLSSLLIYQHIYLPIYLNSFFSHRIDRKYLFICIFLSMYIYPSIPVCCLSIYPSIYFHTFPSISIHLSLSIYLDPSISIHLSISIYLGAPELNSKGMNVPGLEFQCFTSRYNVIEVKRTIIKSFFF